MGALSVVRRLVRPTHPLERQPDRSLERRPDRFEEFFGPDICSAKPFYNFGAGNWRHPCFQNIDIVHPSYPNNTPDIPYDAFSLGPLSIESGSARIFYCSHVNEHLPDRINAHLFSEMFRCLAPGGLIRIAFPDFALACRAHKADDRSFFLTDWRRSPKETEARKDSPIDQLWLDFFATRAQIGSPDDGNRKYAPDEIRAMIGTHGYEKTAAMITGQLLEKAQRKGPGCHINYWTHERLCSFLEAAGFRAGKSAHLQSQCPALRDIQYFDNNMPVLSGYVEAVKG